jgi:hypothetical protein
MSRATPASTAVPPCTSATIVSTASTPCRAPWSCPVAWLTAPTAFARFAAKPSAAELLLGSCALRSATPRRALQFRQSAPATSTASTCATRSLRHLPESVRRLTGGLASPASSSTPDAKWSGGRVTGGSREAVWADTKRGHALSA